MINSFILLFIVIMISISRIKIMYRIIKNLIPNKIFLKLKYFKKFKQNLSFKNPKKFNEKLNYLKIYDDIELKSIYQDKVEVKNIVGKKIGEKYIINTLKVLVINSELESQLIEFDKFILKTNFESGVVYFCDNKKKFNFVEVQKNILEKYNNKFYMLGREMHYSRIPKKVFIEELLQDHLNILDYKFYCFNGSPKYIHVDRNRYVDHKRSFYDLEWNKIPDLTLEYKYDEQKIEKPKNLAKMIEIARELSTEFKFVRMTYTTLMEIYFLEKQHFILKQVLENFQLMSLS